LRITALDTALVDLPLERPLRTAIHRIESVSCLLVTLRTDAGLDGEGTAFCFGLERLRALELFVHSLEPLLVGRDPHAVEALWGEMFRGLNFFGQAGVTIIAMTPVDVACWDLIGKAAGQPLARLFGGAGRTKVPAYASGGLWLSSSQEELQAEARAFVAQGFRRVKLRLGSARIADDIARVEAVRAAIGPEIGLMVDANQGFERAHALRLGRELERFGLLWYEEPVPTWDHAGHAELARALDTPIASGETEYTRHGLRGMVERRAADVLMPDLQRMGGFTEFRRVIGQLAAADLPFSPHLFTEQSLHLLAAADNGLYAEHMPWFAPLYRESLELDAEGDLAVPDRPGVGFTFDWDRLEALRAA